MKKITEKIVTIKDKGVEIEKEIREKTIGYILTSFGLVAGLAWNDAIKSFIERFFSDSGNSLKAKFAYATIITIIVVIVSLYLSRIFHVEKKIARREGEKKEAETIKETTIKTSTEKKK